MKIKRHRKMRRNVGFYKNNFGFHAPYQILIDATFCQAALKCKLNIRDQMPKYLESEVKLMTTACVITEAESLGPPVFGAMLIVKQFQVRKCGHEKKPIGASDCLFSMLGDKNADHYFVATQDPELSKKIRELEATPLLYVSYNAINLEKPSSLATDIATEKCSEKVAPQDFHMDILNEMKKETFGEETTKKRKFKSKEPNPLSCKKKKTKVMAVQPKTTKRPRHRRLRKGHVEKSPDFDN